jgi:hypothetical protein
MKNLLRSFAFASALLAGSAALAADLPVKAPPISFAYPSLKCGMYYGVNTMGSTGSVSNAAIGTQIVQGAVGLTIGYTCPVGAAYWFADGSGDFANLNGSGNGFNATGPASFMERFGFGAPINQLIALVPGLSSLQNAVPSLIPLPTGVNVVTTNPYLALAFHQDDTGVAIGLASNKQYLLSGGFQIGTKTRLSNGLVFDAFAEYTLPSTQTCIGVVVGCIKRGSEFRVGSIIEW